MFLRIRWFALSLLLTAAACHRAPPPAPAAVAASTAPHAGAARFGRLVEHYWDAYLALNPSVASATGDRRFDARLENSVSLQYLADSLDLERSTLRDLASVDAGSLDPASRLDYQIFREGREQAVSGFVFPQELLPVNQIDGMPQRMARMATGEGAHSFADAKGYEDWLSRIEDFSQWVDQAIANLREGQRRGYLLPRVVVERLLPQLESVGREREAAFLRPVQHFPARLDAAERARLTSRLTDAVGNRLLPAYQRLHAFLRDEYLPHARATISMAALPSGEPWYAWRVRRATIGSLTPAQLHLSALAEVQRLHGRLADFAAQSGFAGDLPGFTAFITQDPRFRWQSAAELLDAYKALQIQVASAAPGLFAQLPKTDVQLRVMESPAIDAAAWYAQDGAGAGLLYVNTAGWQRRLRPTLPAGYLREAIPGRHLLLTLQRQGAQWPRFRRFNHDPAFELGWSAYAQSLGDDMGIYADPYARIGATIEELRLELLAVVDTGIHSKGWTRRQSIDYLRAQMPIDEASAAADVDHCIAEPAAVLSYHAGGLAFRAMRGRAQAALGAQFVPAAFHAELLKEGVIPLALLEAKMDRWSKTRVYNPAP